ncbi:MAG: dihydrodipicolinate synthase family protein [Leifsonia sp.]
MTVPLLAASGKITTIELTDPPSDHPTGVAPRTREVFAAAHVVPATWADNTAEAPATIDWDATLAFRRNVWSWGLGVADAMDTAQRNMGLDWDATAELIRRSAAEARSVGGSLVVGVNTDHVADAVIGLEQVIDAYLFQLDVAEEAGAGVVLMASRHLARAAETAADYERVYRTVIERASSPVVLHWLGAAFDAQLAGYFGSTNWRQAAEVVQRIIGDNLAKVRGIKMSLLDADAEIQVRRALPARVRLYTGDDFHYVDLIEGDEHGHSDALLGAFAAVAPRAAVGLASLDAGDHARYHAVLDPTETLARQIFAAPTQFYKTGVAFLSWLNGHQPAFQMVGGLHSGRSLPHLSEIVRLANLAGALEHPDTAACRWTNLLAVNGIRS